MTIEQATKMIEDSYLEEDIKTLGPKDRMILYQNLKEFTRAKLVRSNAMPSEEGEDDKRILIRIQEPGTE